MQLDRKKAAVCPKTNVYNEKSVLTINNPPTIISKRVLSKAEKKLSNR